MVVQLNLRNQIIRIFEKKKDTFILTTVLINFKKEIRKTLEIKYVRIVESIFMMIQNVLMLELVAQRNIHTR
ncbi:MAG: hypothetical protein UY32_C0031G0004 [Candidatus Jorgensenbacteria bacterium GW2011_GWC1_48_8]|uniref:Uncharacterized protein n=1 Tax=Candidatus Jorgensenbacteria bacterium GW2011_GWC1_48_8 TaxID=1618666 RepID=A0A0G1UVP0_9BACT|nr:MAG: hypothetical protein UY32_C0031G0004 [Candidatus Jorgensenbacteria bacterium GW2011_GWC1_48_8]